MILILLVVLSCFMYGGSSKLENVIFPPNYGDSFKTKDGHLKPFGWQRKPDGPIKEYDQVLPAPEFYENHVKDGVPLVYRGAVKHSPAIEAWTDDYLNKSYGHLDVLVELKVEDRNYTTGRMRFSNFLTDYKEKSIYIVSLLPTEMMKDVQAVNSVLCGTFKNFTHESNFWMSNGGTRSVIHYDADENFHCLLAGRKDFMAVQNKFSNQLYMLDKEETAGSSFSTINPDAIDLNIYPKVSQVPWKYATLYAGDCVYLPRQYIHQVRSYGRTIAATTLFTEGSKPKFVSIGCERFDIDTFYSMADIDFHWTYKQGDATIDMGYMNVEILRNMLLHADIFDGFTLQKFQSFYIGYSYGEAMQPAEIMFKKLAKGKGVLTVEDVLNLTRDELKMLGRAIDPPHGPQTKEGEEVYLLPGEAEDNEHMFDEDDIKEAHEMKEIFDDEVERAILRKKQHRTEL